MSRGRNDEFTETSPIGTLRPHHVAISVFDLEETVQWYQEKLNFQLTRKFEVPELATQGAFLELNGFHLEVFVRDKSTPMPDSRRDPAEDLLVHGLKHWAFIVDDLDAVSEELRRRGVEFVWEPNKFDPLNWKYCFIKDNNGIVIELVQALG